jgi:CBS domain-containing protein
MNIKSILTKKGNKIVKISTGSTVEDAAKIMIESKVGAVLIVDDQFSPVGIFTERDNLKITAKGDVDVKSAIVDDYMSTNIVVGTPEDSVEETMSIMTEKRVRHLPIITDNGLAGVVSIGDMVKAVSEAYKVEIKYLKDYITS